MADYVWPYDNPPPSRDDGATSNNNAGASFTPPADWQCYDLSDLEKWSCEPLVPIVSGIIARGNLVYLAAETQTGKSLLCLNLVQSLVRGGQLFGKYTITPVQRVWYFALEDPARRIQERLLDMQHEFAELPSPGRVVFRVTPGLALNNEKMWKWLEGELSTADRPDVVVLDTYQKSTPGLSSFDDKEQSRILHALLDLTRRLSLTVIVIDHLRKAPNDRRSRGRITIDDIKGTGGKAQNADCIILLYRDPKDHARLHLESHSKDFDLPVQIVLKVAPKGGDEPKFTLLEAAEAASAPPRRGRKTTVEDDKILQALRPDDWMTISQIVKASRISQSTVRRRLESLDTAGRVRSTKGEAAKRSGASIALRYRLVVEPDTGTPRPPVPDRCVDNDARLVP